MIAADGSGLRQLTHAPTDAVAPSWSADVDGSSSRWPTLSGESTRTAAGSRVVDPHVKHVQATQVQISLEAPGQGTTVVLQVPRA
jgi:hypothetical protein